MDGGVQYAYAQSITLRTWRNSYCVAMLGRHADLPVSPLLWEEFVRVWRSKWVLWLGTRLRLCGMPQILSAKKTSDVGNVVDLSISTEDQSALHHTPMVERRKRLLNVWLKFPSHGEHEDEDFELNCCVLTVSL